MISNRGTGAPTYYLAKFLPKTAWKWKSLDRERASIAQPLDPLIKFQGINWQYRLTYILFQRCAHSDGWTNRDLHDNKNASACGNMCGKQWRNQVHEYYRQQLNLLNILLSDNYCRKAKINVHVMNQIYWKFAVTYIYLFTCTHTSNTNDISKI